ncbi:TetR/AcrR family transcriptional regulator [Vreelandella janggokensis]|uniref:TetR/AcrR family transcriptional regulator n=1 Tax=Vreelandella janggokensis TaxID=370767 RepID=UPI0028670181|nr:TetR/AcrR family transcriptional regulator [Halomonas janggokensis]MDR5885997.1 TetR/AcrR family transcriptional regulator [Halomonas janggokensis]
MKTVNVKERVLEAAQMLFSKNGYNAVSMRAIAKAADANVGSLTYHFGSKANLLREIYLRHTGPMNQRRMELLGEALRIENKETRLVAILRAYVLPAFSMSENGVGGGAEFTRMRAVMTAEGNEDASAIIADTFDETSRAFLRAISGCVPDASTEGLLWCSQFLLGSLYYALINPGRVTRLSDGEVDGSNRDVAIDQLVEASFASFSNLASKEDVNQ